MSLPPLPLTAPPPSTVLTTRDLEEFKSDLKCKICASLFEEPVVLPCGHVFCKECTMQNLDSSSNCPLCRAKYSRRSFYPLEPIQRMCGILMELGDTLGVADIAATQMSQVIPIKPFVPLQRVGGWGGEAFSQHLREVKSQRPGEISDSESSEAESSSEEPPHHHVYRRGCRKNWRCTNIAGQKCKKLTKTELATRREVYYCANKPCSRLLCEKCHSKETASASTNPAETTQGSSSSSSSTEPDSETEEETASPPKCVFCKLPETDQEQACASLLSTIRERNPHVTDGVLWKMNSNTMSETLKGVEGPFTVFWNKGYRYKSTKCTAKMTKSVRAHDLCLLWSPQTKFKGESSTINPRTVAPAVRNGLNKSCAACGKWGASLVCKKAGCNKAFHIPCGLFTSSIGSIDEQTFTVTCAECAEKGSKRKR